MTKKTSKNNTLSEQLQLPLPISMDCNDNDEKSNICNIVDFIKLKNIEFEKKERERIYKELAEAAKKMPW